jgi:hypothetical protein
MGATCFVPRRGGTSPPAGNWVSPSTSSEVNWASFDGVAIGHLRPTRSMHQPLSAASVRRRYSTARSRGDDITTVDKPALIEEGINLVLAKYRRPAVALPRR